MSDRTGIFSGDDPVALTRQWMAEAEASEPSDANAVSLATVDSKGRPNVRIVLVKEIEETAFVFYTNYNSTKGQELDGAKSAAILFHWKSLNRQNRVRGLIEREDGPQADAYYNSRPLESRYGAHASRQSQPLTSRDALFDQLVAVKAQFPDDPPRPAHWGGYRLVPFEYEFWADGAYRLHDRFKWVRPDDASPWSITRLNP